MHRIGNSGDSTILVGNCAGKDKRSRDRYVPAGGESQESPGNDEELTEERWVRSMGVFLRLGLPCNSGIVHDNRSSENYPRNSKQLGRAGLRGTSEEGVGEDERNRGRRSRVPGHNRGERVHPRISKGMLHFFGDLKKMFQRRNRPQLAIAVLMPMFQNLTGIVFVFAYAPLMFWSMGYRDNANLYSVAVNGSALAVSSLVSMATVDKLGRKTLLISGGVVMFLCQVIVAVMLGSNLFSEQLSRDGLSTVITVFIAIYVLAFGCSWGPLGWTIPSEIFTLETRPVGIAIAVSVNLLFTYIVLQFFIPLLCVFKYGIFLCFSGWVVVMTLFVCFFLPETKGVPVEEMGFLWPRHWFWKRFVAEESQQLNIATDNTCIVV